MRVLHGGGEVIEGVGMTFWLRYIAVMVVLVIFARAFWLAARDEREARRWSEEKECLARLKKMNRRP